MINEEKVRLMTKLAIYEENKGKNIIPLGDYYREDYIGIQMLKSFFAGTIGYVLILLLMVLYQLEYLLNQIVKLDVMAMVVSVLVVYVIFMAVYLGITYIICATRYKKAKKSLKAYDNVLKKLEGVYEREEMDTKPIKW